MTSTTKKTENGTDTTGNRPSHRVMFRRKLKEGYAQAVELGGAWENAKGGISFPVAGGSITIWPIERAQDKAGDAPDRGGDDA